MGVIGIQLGRQLAYLDLEPVNFFTVSHNFTTNVRRLSLTKNFVDLLLNRLDLAMHRLVNFLDKFVDHGLRCLFF